MRLHRTRDGVLLQLAGRTLLLADRWDDIFRDPDPRGRLLERARSGTPASGPDAASLLPPTVSQEVWAAGVTYYRSRDARMEESEASGGKDFYAKVYEADRPELFFKARPAAVVGPGAPVRIRRDARWNVPEPELVLAINAQGRVFGYAVGNDMSSRDIEGDNPLYLPQAKVYDGSCALGPCVLVPDAPPGPETTIALRIERSGAAAFEGRTTLAQLKRRPDELAAWLFRELSFPDGCYLFTGTGIVPPSSFTLEAGDVVSISIDGIGTLRNEVTR